MNQTDPDSRRPAASQARLRVAIRGAVQGVGFRPFLFRLATELDLRGWVKNSPQGVFAELDGPRDALEAFLLRVEPERPPRSSIQSLDATWLDPAGFARLEIVSSDTAGVKTALVLPDIATCPDCLAEIFDPANRRHFYPFTNCTNCGPRFTIIQALPYDRVNTTMRAFAMCAECEAEYLDPANRRFHAQPNACPVCGPRLNLWDLAGRGLLDTTAPTSSEGVIRAAADAIKAGKIVAVKGLGGFHFVTLAGNDPAVRRLRQRKHREEKPLAVMFPSLETIKACCETSAVEERVLTSPEAPIVLLRRRDSGSAASIAPSVAPDNPRLGAFLAYTPLHHLLLHCLQAPIVATSGNLSDEPICIDELEALDRLRGIADLFLVHNRPIARHVDDSIVRVTVGRELVLRRARGYAPLPVMVQESQSAPAVLAVGGHLKSAVALAVGPNVFVSQHIGDLETARAHAAFERVIGDLQTLFEATPTLVAADAHPDYLSTRFARDLMRAGTSGKELITVQHHVAHVLSCMAENELEPPVLGASWDGTGYGTDGTVWGGEFFEVRGREARRFAHLRTFRLPGGEQAIKEPRRAALGLLHALLGNEALIMRHLAPVAAFSPTELATLATMLQRGLNSPVTSSVGRLFDAVAALAGLRQIIRFEGQAAMELEFALPHTVPRTAYKFDLRAGPADRDPLVLDWAPAIRELLRDVRDRAAPALISAKFHLGLVEAVVQVARHAGIEKVVLSGGCFQNAFLTERAVHRLRQEGFRPYWHQRIPPNDGGVCLGQVVAARRRLV